MKLDETPNIIETPISELKIDTAFVRSLLQEQHPDLIHLPIHFLGAGLDNMMFRLGDQLSVRLPQRKAAVKLIKNEQTWLPLLADRLTIPVPTPVRLGKPAKNYPWRWSILPWLAGVTADREKPHLNQAKRFASFLRSLHIPAPFYAPLNPVRAILLNQRTVFFEQRIQRLERKTNLITQKIKDIWYEALNTPIDVQPKWLHGDLHPDNILVKNGAITGIIDWERISSGDIATDLCSIWMLFYDQNARQQAITEYANISDATLLRAKGRAISYGIVLLDKGLIHDSKLAVVGERILRCVSEDG
jgi:aminoglycoside phosphotransferase (APT) family kinase protein